jgi:hypothetical protein
MLPDYPNTKQQIFDALMDYVKLVRAANLGFFATLRVHRHFEGDQYRLVRPDGSVDERGYSEVSSERRIQTDDYAQMSQQDLNQMVEGIAAEMSTEMSRQMYTRLMETLEEFGNVAGGESERLTPELFLRTLESVWIDFDEKGQPIMPTIVTHPDMRPAFERMMAEFDADPEYEKRHKELLVRKWIEWRDREADRKLVG